MDPTTSDAYLHLGKMYFSHYKSIAIARDYFEKAIKYNNKDSVSYFYLGFIFHYIKEIDLELAFYYYK